jgi:hypothetical protein
MEDEGRAEPAEEEEYMPVAGCVKAVFTVYQKETNDRR